MKSETKKLVQYVVGLFIVVLIAKPLTHTSYSIIEYIIRPINISNSTLYLSGFIPFILFIICIRGIFQLEYFKNSKVVTFLINVIAIIPIMNWTIDITRTGYHFIRRDGLNAVDIEESNISMVSKEDTITLNINLTLRDYSRGNNGFKIRVYLPKSMSEYLGLDYCELTNSYSTHGGSNRLTVKEDIELHSDMDNINNISTSRWYQEKVVYELYNDNQTIKIIDYGN